MAVIKASSSLLYVNKCFNNLGVSGDTLDRAVLNFVCDFQ